jgi:hypothetical protein
VTVGKIGIGLNQWSKFLETTKKNNHSTKERRRIIMKRIITVLTSTAFCV